MSTPQGYDYTTKTAAEPGSRHNPHEYSRSRGGTSVLLRASAGDDLCYLLMSWDDYFALSDEAIIGQCIDREWLAESAEGGVVEEYGRI